MKVVAKKNWVYRVYEDGDSYIISVPFGHSYIDFSRAFKVGLESLDDDYLSKKSQNIVDNYELYKEFEVAHPP